MTILYDGDAAGIKASIRGIDLVLEEGMNVKIVLLPDGEDPDSYSKKVSNEEFLKYLKDNETDFIRFKTKLLLAEAGNDPIKKAGLIRDIVKSIAVIPDSITRTIYIKECSNYLEVSEHVIYNEVNKLLRQKSFQDRNNYPRLEDLPVPPPVVAKPIQPESISWYSEREIIRLLLRFGSMEFERRINKVDGNEEVVSVSDYIVNEIISDDLSFDNKACSTIFSDFSFNSHQGLVTGEAHFVKHEDPEISGLAAELLADPHELSNIWKVKQTFIETEENKIREVVQDAVLKFKSDKIKNIRRKIMNQLEEAVKAGETERSIELQKKYAALSVALIAISKKLGDRILL